MMNSTKTMKRKKRNNRRIALSFQLVCVISSAQLLFIEPAQCSSYLDDYFLPTAKLALNKIQQSFPNLAPNNQPVEASTTLAQVLDNVTTTPSGSIIQPSTTETENTLQKQQQQRNLFLDSNEQQKSNDELPIKNDFVRLNTQFEGQTQSSPDLPNNSPPVTIISSTFATNEDPTTSTGLSVAGDEFNLNVGGTFAPSSDQPNVIGLGSSQTKTGTSREEATAAAATTTTTSTPTTTTTPPVVKQIEPLNLSDLGAKVTDNNKLTDGSQDTLQEATIVASDTGSSSSGTGITNNINDEAGQLQTGNVIVIESKSADDAAIKETELDAVAAVDASIGFGADFFASMSDPCYDEYGNARFCEPGFENTAFEKQVEISSECGSPPSRFCTAYLNEHNDQIRNCHICDIQHPKKRHPAAYLTDMNNSNNPTCWVSAPINAAATPSANNSTVLGGGGGGGQDNQQQQQQDNMISSSSLKSDNVTLILNLDKKYEIIYISMQFCSIKPDSLAIYKSMDYGQTWLPYQFYSSQCRRMYGRPSKSSPPTTSGSSITSLSSSSSSKALAPGVEQYIEPSCVNSSQTSSSSQPNSGRIAFSPLGEGRASSGPLSVEKSPVLQDWITATNIKIVLDRHQANWIHSNLVHAHHHPINNFNNSKASNSIDNNTSNNNKQPEQQQLAANNELENSLTSPSNTFNYAMSDLTVGGRCKCNGHASRCIHSKEGKLQCDCRHNTAGRDCEKCATLHFDRPWARASQSDANPCQPCNCNGHSRKCRFDADLYRLSGRRSGGVCIGCRDNTAGRYCHYCREGFTRDHSKPMSDKEACKHCDCHLIGSLGRVCNQTTGQCPCKEGVTGLQCNRCAPGYQQSSSLSEPCLKLPENDINYEPSLTVDSEPDIDPSSTQTDDQQRQQQPNNNPPANNAANSMVEPSIVTENSNIAPPIDGRPNSRQGNNNNNNNNNNRLDEQDTNGGSIDDGDSISDFSDQPQIGQRPRGNKNYQQWNQKASNNARHRNNYYRYSTQHHNQNRHHNQFSAPQQPSTILDEEDEFIETSNLRRVDNSMPSVVDDEYLPASATPIQGGRSVYYPSYNTRQSIQQYKHKYPPSISDQFRPTNQNRANQVSSRIQPNDILMKPMVNLDHGVDDISINSPTAYDDLTDQQQQTNNYGQVYNEDSFNHIHSPRNRVVQSSQRGRQNQLQQLNNVDRFRGYNNNNNNNRPIVEEVPAAARNLVSCGDCQSSTRRLGSKQFCHSEFAIKATILNKFMAEDWTRFDVEIQDIFKSPSLDYLNRNIVVGGPTNYVVDNMLQADEGIIDRGLQVNNITQPIGDRQQTQQQQQSIVGQLGSNHKIKVGTIQSIWVPTEDLTCKCPKLKLRATYLLMGTIDAKENSANSLQLDRHGIALEWKSSLQEKLIKYQRRLAKGSLRC